MITILPSRLKLLHFPRSQLPHVTHAIVKACFFQDIKDPEYFFSFTENAYEISIAANQSIIDNDILPFLHATSSNDMGTSPDIFRVMQVDDADGQDASGKRISDLSEPLAQGKFSIFYMSTYQTDFVLVKERRLRQSVQTLMDHGFEFDQDSLDMLQTESAASSNMIRHSNVSTESLGSAIDSAASSLHAPEDQDGESTESTVLTNELRCAGLNPHYRSTWAMTLLKILSFPDMIENYSAEQSRFVSYTATSEGISVLADKHILDLFEEESIFQDEDSVPMRVIQVNLGGSNLDRCGIVRSISHPLAGEHINLWYLSTYKTANIIVSADDIERAEEILRPDLEKMREMLDDVVLEPLQ
ncbi:hypothetical protein LRAMOSA05959 [Lichtheimia ramosa]|uniref:CASTOR ACT domain-containing protein n=1 Tax=Lichtheimia ramosa TaxID=688394 RepID=A0A077X2H3_9FUNG|nr:hypothetical protein LRAMOSA05959 [Lichtheimia ramosa]